MFQEITKHLLGGNKKSPFRRFPMLGIKRKVQSAINKVNNKHHHNHNGEPFAPLAAWVQWIAPIRCMDGHPKEFNEGGLMLGFV